MISVDKALELILKYSKPLKPVTVKIADVSGHVLAENLRSSIDSPPFDQSAMDGFAIRFADLGHGVRLKLKGEVITGDQSSVALKKGEAIGVFTGAMIPAGADTVVMKENVELQANKISVIDHTMVRHGMHIRSKGSQIRKGNIAMMRGQSITPAALGYLATLGISSLKVFPTPVVSVCSTGNELEVPGKPLKGGRIYESNTYTLKALLAQQQIFSVHTQRVKDNSERMKEVFKKALGENDVLIISGGISVGDYDFVEPVLKSIGVKKVFHKVAQKPGKPLYFGTKGNKLIFALPGNPASVITCFYEFVLPAMNQLMGRPGEFLRVDELSSRTAYSKKPGLTHFLKGYANEHEVEILGGQESYLLNSFAKANCLVVVPENSSGIAAGEKVIVHFIDRI